MAGWGGPGIARPPCPWDPYVVLTPLDQVLTETAKLMSGDSELARWRKRIFQEVEQILQRCPARGSGDRAPQNQVADE